MAETDDTQPDAKSIKLPPAVEVFANLKNAQKFAIDIGKKFYFLPKNSLPNSFKFISVPSSSRNCVVG